MNKEYKFYKYKNNEKGSDYCFCERPCDDNMSLKCFTENGEILGFMSESLVNENENIKEISMNEFMYDFVRPLIKNTNKAIEYLEAPKEIKQQKDKWNELKEYIKETKLKEFEKSYGKRYGRTFRQAELIVCNMIISKMRELEKGSDK